MSKTRKKQEDNAVPKVQIEKTMKPEKFPKNYGEKMNTNNIIKIKVAVQTITIDGKTNCRHIWQHKKISNIPCDKCGGETYEDERDIKGKTREAYICTECSNQVYKNARGYLVYADGGGYVHRNVVERTQGKLKKGQVVHHRDENKLDNSPENLKVFENQEEHQKHHDYEYQRYRLLYY